VRNFSPGSICNRTPNQILLLDLMQTEPSELDLKLSECIAINHIMPYVKIPHKTEISLLKQTEKNSPFLFLVLFGPSIN
jgi:hypothetical protein